MHSFSPIDPISTFVVRIWVEWTDNTQSWRGTIKHLQSGSHIMFQDLKDVDDFIQTWVGTKANSRSGLGSAARPTND